MSSLTAGRVAAGQPWWPRLASALTILLVFVCGAALGAVVMNLGHAHLHQPPFDTPAGKALYFDRLQKELNLTPAQSEQMQSILNDFWQYYRTVLSDSRARVEQILTPEQRIKFEHILQEAQRQ